MTKHTSRVQDTRETETKEFQEPLVWQKPSVFPEPTPQEGYAFHWVRVSINGEADPRSLDKRLQQHYQPVTAEEDPKLKRYAVQDNRYNGRFDGCIEIGGLVLHKVPKTIVEQRNAYYKQKTQKQNQIFIDEYKTDEDKKAPKFSDIKSRVSFGKGRLD